MTDSPDKKNGDAKTEETAPEASPSARGRGGRGGPIGDRGRGAPRGRGGPPGQSPARGGFEGGRGRGSASMAPRGSTPRGGTPRGGRGGPAGGRGGYSGNDSFGNGGAGDDDLMHQLMEEAEAEKAKEPKKFLGRCRLFVGNLPNDMEEDDFKDLFKDFGETSELFLNKQRGFGFVRLAYLHNAQEAKMKMDNTEVKGRVIRVRFASHGAAIKVKYLAPSVSNEMLEQSFSQFGPVERAVVFVDERGKSLGEGLVEFSRKPSAQMAFRRVNEGVFLMTSQPRPILVEMIEGRDEEDGLMEKSVHKNNPMIMKDREQPPRFAVPNTFEYDFAQRWKQLYDLEKQQREQLEVQIGEARERLQDEEQFAIQEWHAQQLRQELEDRTKQLKMLEERQSAERERRAEEHKRRMEEQMRYREEEQRRQEEMIRRDEEMRQRQMDRIRGGVNGGHFGGDRPKQEDEPEPPREKQEDVDGRPDRRSEGRSDGRPEGRSDARADNLPPNPADLIKQRNMQFEESPGRGGGFQGRGFPRGAPPGRRAPDFRDAPSGREDFKRPRWN